MTRPNVECLSCGNQFPTKLKINAKYKKDTPRCRECGARDCKALKSKR